MSLIPSGELKELFPGFGYLVVFIRINESNSLRGVERIELSIQEAAEIIRINESNSLRGVESSFGLPP